MKTEQQLLEMKERIDKRIGEVRISMDKSCSELEFSTNRDSYLQLVAKYNLLIDILNG